MPPVTAKTTSSTPYAIGTGRKNAHSGRRHAPRAPMAARRAPSGLSMRTWKPISSMRPAGRAVLVPDVAGQLELRPAVLGLPDEVGQPQGDGDGCRGPGPGRAQVVPGRRRDRDADDQTRGEEADQVLVLQPDAEGQADREPEPRTVVLQGRDDQAHHDGPGQQVGCRGGQQVTDGQDARRRCRSPRRPAAARGGRRRGRARGRRSAARRRRPSRRTARRSASIEPGASESAAAAISGVSGGWSG